MNPTGLEEAKKLARDVKRGTKGLKKTEVVLCPPFVYISPLSTLVGGSIFLGAQNANEKAEGSLTGEVSFSELYQFGVRFVIVGHSERRSMGESDEVVNKKIKSTIGGGMMAIVCVGESSRDKDGDFYDFIKQQIISALKNVSKNNLSSVVIAYEPLWAVGAKEAMSPRDLQETSIFIKKVLKDLFGASSQDVRILYGGDVDRVNSDKLVRDGFVDGLLIGRESLRAKDFVEIIKLVDAI